MTFINCYNSINNYGGLMQRVIKFFVALPTFLGSMLSCSLCPMCIPMYASVFAAMGIDLMQASPYLLALMLASMIATLTLVYTQIRRNHLSWAPFWIVSISALGIIITKLSELNELMYFFLMTYFAAALWNRTKGAKHSHKFFKHS